MEGIQSRFRCPACTKAILNRKIDRCLYCGETLPRELLFSPEKIAVLDEETRQQEERARKNPAPQAAEPTDFLRDAIDVLDIISDVGDLFD